MRLTAIWLTVSSQNCHLFKEPEKHITHVEQVLKLLQRAVLKIKLKEWFFFTDAVGYLERVIRSKRLKNAAHTSDAIQKLKRLPNIFKCFLFPGTLHFLQMLCP